MRFLFADSFDAVDADFDFQTEQIRRSRNRQMGDVFPHEVLHGAPYDGILLSRATVECWGGSRFTQAQRMRLFSEGVRQFYRFPYAGFEGDAQQYPIMGDCGAFSYREARTPPCRVPDTVDFYSTCGFTHGVSPDHLILAKNDDWDRKSSLPEDVRERQEFTLISAREFLRASQKRHVSFIPVGAVQGWSAGSMAKMARALVDMGYGMIGLGGLAARQTDQIRRIVGEVRSCIPDSIPIHIFGFHRMERLSDFTGFNIASFDSTSPLLKAFRDARHNYFSGDGQHYVALKIPSQQESKLLRSLSSGAIDADKAARLEAQALETVRSYARGSGGLEAAVDAAISYETFLNPSSNNRISYERTLRNRPWEHCRCAVCQDIGVEVVIYRGLNRNKRRGYHNLWVAFQHLKEARAVQYLEVPCIRAKQGSGKHIYCFVADGTDIPRFASLSRVKRSDDGLLHGYQRPEIADHIEDIRRYLDRADAILPNSIVVAFDRSIQYEEVRSITPDSSIGILKLPLDEESRPGWIVDGQQRAAALRGIQKRSFPVSIVAFQSSGQDEERQQFVLVNNTRPLPKSLIYELLPSIGTAIPQRLAKRQKAYALLERLNLTPGSPFFMRVRTATTRHVTTAHIADTSVLKMIENSNENGALSQFGEAREDMLRLLTNYWAAVHERYGVAWEIPPTESRLTHGVGIVSMGYIMDAIAFRLRERWRIPPKDAFRAELESLGDDLPWMEGTWRFSAQMSVPWNEIQNTYRHIDLLSSTLIRRYRAVRRHPAENEA